MAASAEAKVPVEQKQYGVTHPIFGVTLAEHQVRFVAVVMFILALACSYNMYRVHSDYLEDKEYRMSNNLPIYIYLDEIETTFAPYRFICVQRYWYSLDDADKPAIWYIWLSFTCLCWMFHSLSVWTMAKITAFKETEQLAHTISKQDKTTEHKTL